MLTCHLRFRESLWVSEFLSMQISALQFAYLKLDWQRKWLCCCYSDAQSNTLLMSDYSGTESHNEIQIH